MNIVIAGAGSVGTHLAKMLSRQEHNIMLIDTDEEKLAELESQLDILSTVASCTSIGALKDAEVDKCDLFIAVNPQEDQNINSAILAKKLGAKRTIARVNNSEYLETENAEYLRSIGIDSLTVYGVGVPGDSAIIRNRSTVSQVYLPFDVDAASSRFVFRYEQKAFADLDITDTITVAYESRPYFHSKDCGAMYVFDIQSIETSHYLIDSVRVLTPTIDNTNSENIRIYFRTEEADEE